MSVTHHSLPSGTTVVVDFTPNWQTDWVEKQFLAFERTTERAARAMLEVRDADGCLLLGTGEDLDALPDEGGLTREAVLRLARAAVISVGCWAVP